ncbi:glycosyltransferase family 2 protein [Rhodococcus sp. SBT000017]|uniref:glycosyltransferase family 2 protein n=1 Tax=Rhodococcus sp. SBT000017 TaxID=1803385 RepID=UPI000EF91AD0|nr:glycosyltransferase family 2 protein [Rhodococcus sp. SBT000017]RMB77375.1 glycosyltransferase family 2 protein [Rhodococcus sp. SBT000017]
MTTVSVVIPTVGRSSLSGAVDSALQQSFSVCEVIVVADTADELGLAANARIKVLRCGPGAGAQRARQIGIRDAVGDVIALLDDDDLWHPYKIEAQMLLLEASGPSTTIVSCACVVRRPDGHEKILPRVAIEPRQDIAEYLYTYSLHRSGLGNGVVQTSTLLFPAQLALDVPLDERADAVHDESTWLLAVRSKYPRTRIEQLNDPFVIYRVTPNSLSNNGKNDVSRYLDWGQEHLHDASPRVRGDYYLTSPVAAAASAGSTLGIRQAIRVGSNRGSPGIWAVLYAVAKLLTVSVRAVRQR